MDNIQDIRQSGDSWAEWENEILRLNYNGYGALKKCKHLLPHRNLAAIQSHANRYLGIKAIQRNGVLRFREKWVEWEDAYLEKSYQIESLYTMSKYLERTPCAVAQRCKVLNLNRMGRDGWYALSEVALIFGCAKNTVGKLITDNLLVAKRRFQGENPNNMWEIKEDALYNFITKYPDFLQGRIVDMFQLVNILTKGDIKHTV